MDTPFGFRRHTALRALALVIVLACSGTPVLATNAKASQYYEDALVRYEKQDLAGAIIQLKNALNADKQLLPVHVLLGKALLDNGEMVAAEVALNEALRLGVNRAEVAVPLARALAGQGRPQAMFDHDRLAPAGLPPGVQAELLLVLASAHSDLGKPQDALSAIEKSRQLNPDTADSWLSEIPVRIRARQFREAFAAAEKAVTLSRGSADALYLMGSVAHAAGQLDAAIESYSQALKMAPAHNETLLARGGILLDQGRWADAQADIQAARNANPKEPRAAYLWALLAERNGDNQAARAALADVTGLLDPVPVEFMRYRPQLLILGGLAHYGLGQLEKAKPYLEAAQRQQATSPAAKLLAQIHIHDKNLDRAIEALDGYLRGHPGDGQAQILLANAHAAQGRHARAAQVLQTALKYGETAKLRAALGVSLLKANKPNEALPQLEAAVKQDPAQTRAGAALVSLYLRGRQPSKAITLAESLIKQEPQRAEHHNLLGVALRQSGKAERARSAFESALRLEPALAPAEINLARLATDAGRLDEAAAHLNRVLTRQDNHVEALLLLAGLADRRGQEADATRLYEKAAAHGATDDALPLLMLFAHHMRGERFGAADTVVKQLNLKAPESLSVQMANARLALANQDAPGARLHLTRASRSAEFDVAAQVQVALLQMQAQDAQGALYSLSKALQSEPANLLAQAMMVEAELATGEHAKAEQRAKALVNRHPRQAIGHSLLGDVARVRGQTAASIDAYRRAHQLEPSSETLLRLHRALATTQPSAALQLAAQWLKRHPQDAPVGRALADAHARGGDMRAARLAYEAVLRQHPNDAEALNNYAHVLLALKDPGAQQAADRALALRPQSAHIVGTAGWAAFRAGQTDRSLQLLRDARLRDPGNEETRYYLASVLASSGRKAEARRELQAALQGGASFASAQAARDLLRSLE